MRPTTIAVSGITVTTTPAAAGDSPQPSTSSRTTRKKARPRARPKRGAERIRGQRRSTCRLGSRVRDETAEDEQQRESERNPGKDRFPPEQLREDTARGRPERGSEHARGDPDAQSAPVGSVDPREQVEASRNDQRGAERLNAARADEHLERGREPARER